MRQTYMAPAESAPSDDRRPRRAVTSRSPRVAGAVAVAALLDVAAAGFSAMLLWLGAGTTVLSGEPVAMSLAFAGGVVLAALSNLRMARAGTRGAVTIALTYAVLLAAAYAVRVIVVQTYFFSWIVVYAGAFLAARVAVALVVDGFARRAGAALVWRVTAICAGVAVVVLLGNVWNDSALLGDLIVFVVLLSIAAVLFELGIRSFRISRATAD